MTDFSTTDLKNKNNVAVDTASTDAVIITDNPISMKKDCDMGPKEKETCDIVNNAAEALVLGTDVSRCNFALLCDIAISLAKICDKELKGE